MNTFIPAYLVAGVLGILATSTFSRAETETSGIESRRSAAGLAPGESSKARQYAADRDVQVAHLILDVTPDFDRRTIDAKAVMRIVAVAVPAREVRLDAIDLNVHSVTASEPIQAWQVTEENIIVTFAQPIPAGKQASLTVSYSAEPTEGLYFRTPEMGYRTGDTHLFSQGEAIEARHWYPCLDSPNQRFTSEIICRVPAGMTVISNGKLLSETKDQASGLVAVHWSQEQPHANYLISLVAGYFKKLQDNCHGIPLAFYTPPSEISEAASSFRDTKDMIAFFEKEIGVAYPWAKYDQVCVNDFVAGGMENTSATTLTDYTLFTDATENIRTSEGLVSHELAHQWFGDLVTCKDWSHLWLNEGFATYYESLYNAHKNGRDNMLFELYHRAIEITGMPNDTNAIVRRTYQDPGEMFSYLVYPKAGWVLHMLRSQLGEEIFRQCVKTFLERYRFANAATEDFRGVVEELSGRSFDQFFDQWLYHGGFPELEVSYSWDESSRLAKLSVRQLQEGRANVLLFNFPLAIRFKGRFGVLDRQLQVSRKQEDFYFPLESAAELVRLDPQYTLLAKARFSVPGPMLRRQLVDETDVLGRLLAVEQLAGKRDQESISGLRERLNRDPFYGVRLEAAQALGSIHTDEAFAALLASTNQPDARVRRQVVENIGHFYNDQASSFACAVLEREKNPDILTAAIRQLGGYSKPEVHEKLLRFLRSESYRNELADAAIAALRSQDDPACISVLLEILEQRCSAFTTHGFAQGLSTLAYLARNQEQKANVREFLLKNVKDRRQIVQLAALNALGALGDTRAIPVLEKYASAAKDSPERRAAEHALPELRAARRPVDDFKNLRNEVFDLQKTNRELRSEMDELKKKLEVLAARPDQTTLTGSRSNRPPQAKIASPRNK
jgi:aminopeptidase N